MELKAARSKWMGRSDLKWVNRVRAEDRVDISEEYTFALVRLPTGPTLQSLWKHAVVAGALTVGAWRIVADALRLVFASNILNWGQI